MQLKIQTADNCLLYSAAMLLDEDPEVLIREIGHDGNAIWFPDRVGSQAKRSFHPAEINDCCMRRGYAISTIEMMPRSGPAECKPGEDRQLFELDFAIRRFISAVKGRPGILICQMPGSNVGHACAWDGEQVFDPRGFLKSLEDYNIGEMWLLVKLI